MEMSSSPYNNQQPPPVDLNSHPSRRQSYRTSMYENVDTDSGIGSCGSRRGSTMTEMTDGEQFQLDTEDDPSAPMRSETDPAGGVINRHPTFCNAKSTPSHYQVPPVRSHTVSSPRPSLHSSDYERMINPKANVPIQAPPPDDQYIQMRPAPNRSNSLRSVSDSPPTNKALHPIAEGRVMTDRRPLNYENTTFQSSVQEHEFEYYTPKYENMDQFREKRHSSFSGRTTEHGNRTSPGSNVRMVETPSPPVIIPTP